MNLDIFANQAEARKKSRLFMACFILTTMAAVFLIYCLVAYCLVSFTFTLPILQGYRSLETTVKTIFNHKPEILAWRPLAVIALPVAAVIITVAVKETLAIRNGGGAYMAQLLGGVLIDINPADPKERLLSNVVKEMSVASGLTPPLIYLLPREVGINAMTAGQGPEDAVVIVTRGALDLLCRDELQGVVAHEFGHILNYDCALNCRMSGCLAGLMYVSVLGRELLNIVGRFGGRGGGRAAGLVVFLVFAGLAVCAAGFIGKWAAELVQAAFSRQREHLADAFSAQFTRNPAGLASALKKIGGFRHKGLVRSGRAILMQTFFIANPAKFSGLFRSHPPLEERIRALEPSWDGEFTPIEYIPEHVSPETAQKLDAFGLVKNPFSLGQGAVEKRYQELGRDWRGGLALVMLADAWQAPPPKGLKGEKSRPPLPPEAAAAALAPDSAAALAAAAIVFRSPAENTVPSALAARAEPYRGLVTDENRLPLLDLAAPALAKAGPAARLELKDLLKRRLPLHEGSSFSDVAVVWVFRKMFPERSPAPGFLSDRQADSLTEVRRAAGAALSAVARQSEANEAQARLLYEKSFKKLNYWAAPEIMPPHLSTAFAFSQALEILHRAPKPVKLALLAAAAETAIADKRISQLEYEYLRALQAALT
ncbi:MAG: M48 family metalloprotease [Candidatus Adiutrix sp.]|nr:M48 family metalloprotease [Candidatus Adiutrix sp.]